MLELNIFAQKQKCDFMLVIPWFHYRLKKSWPGYEITGIFKKNFIVCSSAYVSIGTGET